MSLTTETPKSGLRVAVVVLAWNGKEYLARFLPSLVANTDADVRLILADNASTDDSVAFVEAGFPRVEVLRNDRNYGFAGGYNQALRRVDADVYVLLNQDVEVSPGWVKPVLDLMASDPTIAAVQPKIRSLKERASFEYAGAAGGMMDAYGYPFCRGRIFYEVEKDRGQYNHPMEIFWASGACMFVRSARYWEAGGLDDDFFAHMEEIDLCWRIKNAGHRVMYCPDSIVYHLGGGSLPQGNPRKTYLNFRNNLIMLYKNLPLREMLVVIGIRVILDGLAAAYSLLVERRAADVLAIIKAHWSFYFGLGKWRGKRKQARALVSKPNTAGRVRKSIVWQFFARKRRTYGEIVSDQSTKLSSAKA